MTKQEELEQMLYKLHRKQEEADVQFRQSLRELEETEDDFMAVYGDLDWQWEEYGRQDDIFTALLEEEREQVGHIHQAISWMDDELRDEYRRNRNRLEDEYYEIQRQMKCLREEGKGGDHT